VIIVSECLDVADPPEFSQWFRFDTKLEMERALRADFTIPGWVAWREVECGDKAAFIMVTLPQNADFVRKANMIPASTMEEALEIAYKRCRTKEPRITMMPQGANILPVLRSKP
jgi:hypothetical protein